MEVRSGRPSRSSCDAGAGVPAVDGRPREKFAGVAGSSVVESPAGGREGAGHAVGAVNGVAGHHRGVLVSEWFPPAGEGPGWHDEDSVAAIVDDLSRTRPTADGYPIGLLFTLIADDRPPVRVIDGVSGPG